MDRASVFETITLPRSVLVEWPSKLKEIRTLMERSEIKIVDIRRERDNLVIVFRRLYAPSTVASHPSREVE
ncbi:hypothetical protein GCM10010885_04250 [Alicyclobacillus cellulosilyticus]|uniref:Uncharacterized protein n=1 Tax=Alicyclobacillus cellulosilyticus TaxID=1003997 RepID=A0A917NG04_9BACL|nr:hypothetical protein [Alicyclobacillus cellulosilyticus]GGI97726.1 hypothetical protein GCM10010885_04250 [Alicyclobacillus cellulosilyticus]